MLKIDFLVFYYMETVGVKWPGLEDTNFKLSDTLMYMTMIDDEWMNANLTQSTQGPLRPPLVEEGMSHRHQQR